jgi:hypothetical protein
MRQLFISLLFVVSCFAQSPADLLKKAPPEIEQALRTRINIFYQAHVDGKWRLADAVVAEDSKDTFFSAQKPKLRSFEIVRFNWSDDFKKATVVVGCSQDWFLHGEKIPVVTPITTTWRLEKGEWFMYIEPDNGGPRKTPFGMMTPGPPSADGATPGAIPSDLAKALKDDAARQQMAAKIFQSVAFDKQNISLASDEIGAETITIKNSLRGEIVIEMLIENAFAGLSIELDRTRLNFDETAIVNIRHEPRNANAKPQVFLRFRITPTGQNVVIPITFRPPSADKAK